MKSFKFIITLILIISSTSCLKKDRLEIIHEISGPINTNSYLIYGDYSKEAAIIDPGWQIDTLVNFIIDNDLKLKYIFITHGHIDHYYFVPQLEEIFPEAKWCLHEDDYRDIFTEEEWIIENYGQEWIDEISKDSMLLKYLQFDPESLGEPDIFLEEDMVFKLGTIEIMTLHTPGHSPGGICFFTEDRLFSGDVLFHKSVGRIDTQHGSKKDQIESVIRLYESFPDSMKVYPGHKKYTTIGFEKKENRYVRPDGGRWIEEK